MAFVYLSKEEDSINYSQLADDFIKQIARIASQMNDGVPCIVAAIVDTVHPDGSVDVYFPPEKDKLLTNISNQSIYQNLKPGDSVRIMEPHGKTTDCWICAKDRN